MSDLQTALIEYRQKFNGVEYILTPPGYDTQRQHLSYWRDQSIKDCVASKASYGNDYRMILAEISRRSRYQWASAAWLEFVQSEEGALELVFLVLQQRHQRLERPTLAEGKLVGPLIDLVGAPRPSDFVVPNVPGILEIEDASIQTMGQALVSKILEMIYRPNSPRPPLGQETGEKSDSSKSSPG